MSSLFPKGSTLELHVFGPTGRMTLAVDRNWSWLQAYAEKHAKGDLSFVKGERAMYGSADNHVYTISEKGTFQ